VQHVIILICITFVFKAEVCAMHSTELLFDNIHSFNVDISHTFTKNGLPFFFHEIYVAFWVFYDLAELK